VDAAIKAAASAFRTWSVMPPLERGDRLRALAALLRRHAEELAWIDSVDCGNPIAEMMRDVEMGARGLEYFAGLVTEIKGETIPVGHGFLDYTIREPLGVVARVIAYNHPIMFATMRCAAPLAAGNTLVLKPSEQAPLSALRLAELLEESKVLPTGVINIVTGGRGCGEALSKHPGIARIALIGSVPTGKAILRSAAETVKSVGLEMGGKNALIAYPDADTQAVADGAVLGMNLTWAGQSCGSTSRLFLHASHHDDVLARIVAGCAHYRAGDPTDAKTTMGPLISAAQFDKVKKYVAWGLEDGARLVAGGRPIQAKGFEKGYFFEPTIFADVTPSMRIAREEIFGPVLSVFRWDDEHQMFDQVNGTDYGLSAAIFTKDLNTAHRAAARVQAGYVWVNHAGPHFVGVPFGGYKQSGVGREESLDELFACTQIKNVNIKLSR
jgi:betaine-aldehyde dehydrogenase